MWRAHKFWVVRAMLVLTITAMAEALVAWLVPQPIVWVALIAGSLPLSMIFLVALPLLESHPRRSGT
jgi:hypothetical protein